MAESCLRLLLSGSADYKNMPLQHGTLLLPPTPLLRHGSIINFILKLFIAQVTSNDSTFGE